jgi:membrane protein DedA with SNARE-associated domain
MHIESLSGVLLYLAAFLIIFGENGVFFLFFLPGDSLLFALGVLATKGTVSLWYLIPILIIAAIGGNLLGYWLGSVTGRGFVKRLPKVKPEHLERAKRFYDTHGLLAVFLARWIPVLRTIVRRIQRGKWRSCKIRINCRNRRSWGRLGLWWLRQCLAGRGGGHPQAQ